MNLQCRTEQNFSARMDGGHPPCSFEKVENNQDSLVKNLRKKFQNLSSYCIFES